MSTSIVTLVIIRVSRTYLRRYATRMADSTAGYISILQEAISAIRIVKGFSAERIVHSKFSDQASLYMRSAIKLARIHEAIPTLNEVFAIAALSVVLFLGGHEVFAGRMSASDLMTFLFALFAIMAPTVALVSVPGQIQRGLIAAERVFDLMDQQPSIVDGSLTCEPFTNACRLDSVTFSYNHSHQVLRDVSLTISKGKKIAVVGASGSGKSTLVDVLVRFYDPQSGSVSFDGINIRSLNSESYRRRFGIVSQDTVLFHDSVANNIAFGSPGLNRESIETAARIAHAHEFISQLPHGYDTIVGDRGVLLSGGQRQRIAIARALAHNPDILIFDEATSALDSASETIVQNAINDLLRDRTAVIIAHRLSTIVHCDTIIVMNNGTIAEQGTHEELLAKNGIYTTLYALQFNQPAGDS
jgi:subfamily B ATP-binding cassette protein MsbA